MNHQMAALRTVMSTRGKMFRVKLFGHKKVFDEYGRRVVIHTYRGKQYLTDFKKVVK